MISQEELMTILDYNAQTGVFTWKKPPKEHARLSGKEAGTRSTKYILIRINNNKYKAHRLAWLAIYGEFPSDEIDHINGDKHDNRIANLRTATPQQNQANKRRNKGKSTPKGVRLLPSGLYQSRITINGKQLSLGSFRTHQDASAEYMRVAKSHYGQYARAD